MTDTTYEVYYINSYGRDDLIIFQTLKQARRFKNMMNGTIVKATRKEIE